jgi:hypothetical protein
MTKNDVLGEVAGAQREPTLSILSLKILIRLFHSLLRIVSYSPRYHFVLLFGALVPLVIVH